MPIETKYKLIQLMEPSDGFCESIEPSQMEYSLTETNEPRKLVTGQDKSFYEVDPS